MDVVLDGEREGVVDNRSDVRDVESTRSNVRRDQHACGARLEVLQRLNARGLRQVSVQTGDGEALALQHALYALRFLLVQREDKDACLAFRLLRHERPQMTE